MSLANLWNIPRTPQELNIWASAHMSHHRDIIRRVYEIGGVSLSEFVLEPIDPENVGIWVYQHQMMHQQMDSLLGIQGFNLLELNFKNTEVLARWIEFNAIEHTQVAEMLQIGVPEIPVQTVTSTFTDNAEQTLAASSYTFPGLSFGSPSADRYVVACIGWQTGVNAALTGVTIGGVAATLLTAAGFTIGRACAIVIAAVPAGATGDVDVTFNDVSLNCSVAVYSLIGIGSAAASGVYTALAASPSVSITVNENGTAIAAAVAGAGSPPTASWSNLVEDCDNNYGIGNLQCRSAASRNFTEFQSGLLATCTFTVSTGSALAVAVFNP